VRLDSQIDPSFLSQSSELDVIVTVSGAGLQRLRSARDQAYSTSDEMMISPRQGWWVAPGGPQFDRSERHTWPGICPIAFDEFSEFL
jgi:hypothetical protein